MKKIIAIIFTIALQSQAGTVTGQIQTTSSGQGVTNGTLTFSLTQSAVVSGTALIVTTPYSCNTDANGNVVGLPNPLATPVLSTNLASGALSSGNYFVKLTYSDATGETVASPESQINLAGQGTLIVSVPIVQPSNGQTPGWKIYIGTTSGGETLQSTQSGFGSQYQQSTPLSNGAALPSSNTSQCKLRFNDEMVPSYTGYNVTMKTSSGTTVSGWPQKWYLSGGATGTVNVSSGAPLYSGIVTYPQPVFTTPANNGQQSISGPLNIAPYSMTAGSYNKRQMCDTFTGATTDAKLNACYAIASTVGPCIMDASGLGGSQTIASTVTIGATGTANTNCIVILPASAVWTCTITNGTDCFDLYSMSAFVGPGAGNSMVFALGSSASVGSIIKAKKPTSPAFGENFTMGGFSIQPQYNGAGGVLTGAALDLSNVFDSYFYNFGIGGTPGKMLWLHDDGVQAFNSVYFFGCQIDGQKVAGARPVVVSPANTTGGSAVHFFGCDIGHPGAGQFNIEINGNGGTNLTSVHVHGGYEEANSSDTTTCLNRISDVGQVSFEDVNINRLNAASTACGFSVTETAPNATYGTHLQNVRMIDPSASGNLVTVSGVAGYTNETKHYVSDWSPLATEVVANLDALAAFGIATFFGSTSGVISAKTQAASGTWEWDWPTTAGTAGQALTSQGGAGSAMTWSNFASNSAGNNVIPKSNGTNFVASSLTDNGTLINSSEELAMGTAPVSMSAGDLSAARSGPTGVYWCGSDSAGICAWRSADGTEQFIAGLGATQHYKFGAGSIGGANYADMQITNGLIMLNGTSLAIGVNGSVVSLHQKIQNATTGSINATTRVEVLVNWPNTMADTNYAVSCSVQDSVTAAATQGLTYERIKTKSATQVGVVINNPTAGALTGSIDCLGDHQ